MIVELDKDINKIKLEVSFSKYSLGLWKLNVTQNFTFKIKRLLCEDVG